MSGSGSASEHNCADGTGLNIVRASIVAGSFSGGETINALDYRPSASKGIVSKDPKPLNPHAKTVDALRYETGR